MLGTVDVIDEKSVSQTTPNYQIDFSLKEGFQRILEIKKVADKIKLVRVCGLKINQQIHIAVVIESIRQYRPEDSERLNLVLATKFYDSLKVELNQFHTANLANVSDITTIYRGLMFPAFRYAFSFMMTIIISFYLFSRILNSFITII